MIPLIPIPEEVWLYLLEFIDPKDYVRSGGELKSIVEFIIKSKYKMNLKDYTKKSGFYLPILALRILSPKRLRLAAVYNSDCFKIIEGDVGDDYL